MCMKEQRGQVFRSDNRARQYKDGKGKGSRSSRLANYYKQFIKDFVRIAKPLYKMMRKDVK